MRSVPRLRRFPAGWRPRSLSGQRVLVAGLGRFGGGRGAARFLVRQGATVTVTDLKGAEAFGPVPAELAAEGVDLRLGEDGVDALRTADWIVASPAVPWDAPVLRCAGEWQVPVETEISLLARVLPCEWLGISGTNGKSTTTTLAHAMLTACERRCWLGGNLGGSLLGDVEQMRSDDVAVLELSSFQLEHLGEMGVGPGVAVLTSVSADHLDRHGSLEAYHLAKEDLLCAARVAVLHRGDPVSVQIARRFSGEIRWFGSESNPMERCTEVHYSLMDGHAVQIGPEGQRRSEALSDMRLIGRHNQENLLAAAAAAVEFGAPFEDAIRAGCRVEPLRQRLQLLRVVDGVRFVDDSVSTSPQAVAAALSSFDGGIHLLVGGYDKGLDLGPMLEEIFQRGARCYLYGRSRERVDQALQSTLQQRDPSLRRRDRMSCWEMHEDIAAAFAAAVRHAVPGDVVLLSPGFASYDQFSDFTQRGELYRSLVERHEGSQA